MWNETPTKAELVAEAARPDGQVWYRADVAGEWRRSKTPAESFEKFGPGPATYRIPA